MFPHHTFRRLAAGIAIVALAATTAPAEAATIRIDDPNRDGLKGAALDITSVTVKNTDRAIITIIDFRRVVNGDLAIYYQARGTRLRDIVGVASEHRSAGDRNFLLAAEGQQCAGLRVTWNATQDTARVRLPASCLQRGNYGAVRIRMITEIGSDADTAPSTPRGDWPWGQFVARG